MSVFNKDGSMVADISNQNLPFLSINHKGYRRGGAADNSLAAFRASYAHGFRAVETDIRYSSDNIPVLAHNETFSGMTIAETPYATLAEAGICSLEELIQLCKSTGLIPYLEIKIANNTMTDYAIEVVAKYGMMRNVVWISAYMSALEYVLSVCEVASVRKQSATIAQLESLSTGKNIVGSYYGTGAAGSGIDATTTIPVAKAGFVVGAFTYTSQSANMVLDSQRGATEFTTDYAMAEDIIVTT